MTLGFFSDILWHGLHQRPQHIASRLAQQWPVLWIEPATLLKRPRFTPVEVEQNLHILSIPAFPYNARFKPIRIVARLLSNFPLLRWIELYVQTRILRSALRRLGVKEIGFFIHNFSLGRITRHLHPKFIVFDYIDNAFGFVKMPRHVHDAWIDTIRRADIITATTRNLKQQIEAAQPVQTHLISNGVEYDLFATQHSSARPHDLPATGKPIAVYIGAVNKWFDFDLMELLLTRLQDIGIVVIGTEHPEIRTRVKSLMSFPNFTFLGLRPYHTIASYLHHCAVGIIPFKKNPLTAGVNPVKLYEYSAAGIPTVATDFSEDLAEFKDLIFIARSAEEFPEQIRRALTASRSRDFTERLRSFARQNDWATKTEKLTSLIQQCLTSHPERTWQNQGTHT